MRICVKTLSGETRQLQVQPGDTAEQVKCQIWELTKIPVHHQRLRYAGKLLKDYDALLDCNISTGATLHLSVSLGPQNLLQTSSEAFDEVDFERAFQNWQELGVHGDFDDDLYIVNPDAHYARLRSLELKVVRSSEWFRCRGKYHIHDDKISETSWDPNPAYRPARMWPNMQSSSPSFSEDPSDVSKAALQASRQILRNLRRSYLMICHVFDNFGHLCEAGFCTSYYSFLIKHNESDVAEVVRISADLIDSIKTGIEHAAVEIGEGGIEPDRISPIIKQRLVQSCSEALALHRLPREMQPFHTSVVQLCRMTAILLDLALVSYVGSHGLRFDLEYINTGTPSILVNSGEKSDLRLGCSLQQLACLDEFLDGRKMWVFQFYVGQPPVQTAGAKKAGRPLSILARMEEFADLWGPIWSIPMAEGHPDRIKQYNTSKGVICRVSANPADADQGIAKCHWYSWSSFQRRQDSELFAHEQEYFMEKDDLLLIGIHFHENLSCSYRIGDFERSYGYEMGVLGTSNSRWKLESRAVGLSFSKIVGIQVQGTQKQIPETTLKQHVLDKWVNRPERANPGILNQFLGVMISHCTGNAVRISLRAMLLSKAILPMLNRQFPEWETTGWGSPFLRALESTNPEDVFQVWEDHSSKRREMAQLVCCALEILDTTGMGNDAFTAAFLQNDQERSFEIDLQLNQWFKVLRDSPLTAVYAFVNESCIECFTADHRTATCNDLPALTVLQTQMIFPECLDRARVKVLLQGQYFRVNETLGTRLVISPTSTTRSFFFYFIIPAREIRDPLEQGGQSYQVYVQASSKGFNGRASPRNRSKDSFIDPNNPRISVDKTDYTVDDPDFIKGEEQHTNQDSQARLSNNFQARMALPLGVQKRLHIL